MKNLNVVTVGELCRAERAARFLARRAERDASREAVRSLRRASLARKTMEEGAGVLTKVRGRLAAHVAARKARQARLLADMVARRLERVERALEKSHEREARRVGICDLWPSCGQDFATA